MEFDFISNRTRNDDETIFRPRLDRLLCETNHIKATKMTLTDLQFIGILFGWYRYK